MIQRKQTLFLLAIVGLLITMMFNPLATSMTAATDSISTAADGSITKTSVAHVSNIELNTWELMYDGESTLPLTYLTIVICLATLIAAITIFLFKFRLIQIRLCYAMAVLLFGLIAFIILYLVRLSEAVESMPNVVFATNYSMTSAFPILCLVLLWFAYRGIIKDESLVRSLNRIR